MDYSQSFFGRQRNNLRRSLEVRLALKKSLPHRTFEEPGASRTLVEAAMQNFCQEAEGSSPSVLLFLFSFVNLWPRILPCACISLQGE
jgi:hypothetical protein